MKKATNVVTSTIDVQQSLSNERPLSSGNYNTAVMYGRAYAEADQPHPLQKKIRFVFTDFLPNGNKQGVPETEAENVITSSLYMPVKINFDGQASKGHNGAEPIGPIIMMQKEQSQIIGSAVVWVENNQDIVDYLLSASAETDGVQFSWELFYHDSELDDNGTEWLHGIVSAGICIVDDPAYKGRTPLLAIAEQQAEKQKAEGNQMDELQAQVQALTERLYTMMEALYAALDEAKPQIDTTNVEDDFNKLLDKLRGMASQFSETKSQAETLQQEVVALREFKAQVETEAHRQETISARKAAFVDAGIKISDEAFSQKETRILAMDDEAFAAYLSDLKEAIQQVSTSQATNQAKSSVNSSVIPDPLLDKKNTEVTLTDLANALRSARRTRRIEDSNVLSRE